MLMSRDLCRLISTNALKIAAYLLRSFCGMVEYALCMTVQKSYYESNIDTMLVVIWVSGGA